MNIFFRVDSSNHMGMGHVMRCMVLANTLRKINHSVTFICRELPGNSIDALRDAGYPIILLPFDNMAQKVLLKLPQHKQWVGASRELDLQQTLVHLKKSKPIDWLIIDHYGLDVFWENSFRPYIKKIMVLDDLQDRSHDCDILLDQNFYIHSLDRYHNQVPKHCKLLIGPQYALLRPEFKKQREHVANRDGEIRRLMVSLGGSDNSNGTRKILEGIHLSNYKNLPVDVILTANSPHKYDIQKLCAIHKNLHFHCSTNNMSGLMNNASLSIGAGGTTTWERCCLGLPCLVVRVANNQDELIKQGLLANLFDYIGDIFVLQAEDIANKLNQIGKDPNKLLSMSQNGMNLIDGSGVNRVVYEILAQSH